MNNNISMISSKKDEEGGPYKFIVTYDDLTKKEYIGDYMGHSSEYSPMMVILKDMGDDHQYPVAVINADKIRSLEMKGLKDD